MATVLAHLQKKPLDFILSFLEKKEQENIAAGDPFALVKKKRGIETIMARLESFTMKGAGDEQEITAKVITDEGHVLVKIVDKVREQGISRLIDIINAIPAVKVEEDA